MRLFFLTIALSAAGCLAQEYEELELYNNYDEYGPLTDAAGGGGSKGQTKLGFSAGSGLRSIAEGSFNSANDAVNNQDAAGHQAAFVAKNTLAQAAAGAQRSADATMRAAQEARAHVNVLTNTLNAAQTNADHMTQAASEAAGELAAQQSMVGSAKQRVDQLSKQLASVRIDFEATRAAAQKAQAAAQAAAANAAAAAAAAAADLAKSAPSPAPSAGKGGNGGGGGKGSSGGQGGKGGGQGGKGASAGKYIQGIEGNVAYVEDNFYHPFHYSK
ncbi:PE-PGRS family protein PE_PGRS8 isoform X3 [Tribolium castaneum]|uniref:PE-PGRS family protein PE_PGRS8 isoform X3 n=1 Tax=Tribolium castaneum TaxID=7070 RepID=UPI0030FE6816